MEGSIIYKVFFCLLILNMGFIFQTEKDIIFESSKDFIKSEPVIVKEIRVFSNGNILKNIF